MKSRTAVLLAAWNGERYLEEQIESILHQTGQDFELYIHDDGSDDGTQDILRDYSARYPGIVHILEYEPQGGAAANFFSLLQRVEAEYYFFSDQDDVWLPEKMEHSLKLLCGLEEKNGQNTPALVFSDLRVVDAHLGTIDDSYLHFSGRDPRGVDLVSLLRRNVAAGCTIAVNRACVQAALHIPDIRQVFMHDWWLMLTAAACGEIAFLEEATVLYRQHGANAVGAGESTASRVRRITKNLLTGRQIEESRRGIRYLQNCIRELNRLPETKSSCRELLRDLEGANSPDRLQRMRTFRKYRLLRNDLSNAWKILLV